MRALVHAHPIPFSVGLMARVGIQAFLNLEFNIPKTGRGATIIESIHVNCFGAAATSCLQAGPVTPNSQQPNQCSCKQ